MVSELRCHEDGCPAVEMVKINKPAAKLNGEIIKSYRPGKQ